MLPTMITALSVGTFHWGYKTSQLTKEGSGFQQDVNIGYYNGDVLSTEGEWTQREYPVRWTKLLNAVHNHEANNLIFEFKRYVSSPVSMKIVWSGGVISISGIDQCFWFKMACKSLF